MSTLRARGRSRSRAAAAAAAAITCTLGASGCSFSCRFKTDADPGLAGSAAGGLLGGVIGGPGGAAIGSDLGYVIATGLAAYGVGKHRQRKATAHMSPATATPQHNGVHVRKS